MFGAVSIVTRVSSKQSYHRASSLVWSNYQASAPATSGKTIRLDEDGNVFRLSHLISSMIVFLWGKPRLQNFPTRARKSVPVSVTFKCGVSLLSAGYFHTDGDDA